MLKHTIAVQLNWTGFGPPASLKCMKVHDFSVLVRLTGREATIKKLPAWSTAVKWTPDMRYEDPAKARYEDACEMTPFLANRPPSLNDIFADRYFYNISLWVSR